MTAHNTGDRPKLLDLFCCEGGAGMGYHHAGFDVFGVDIEKQRRYPFAFHHGDALVVVRRLLLGEAVPFMRPDGELEWLTLSDFAAIHASPPCQAYSVTKHSHSNTHPELIVPTRELLIGGYTPLKSVRAELMGMDWATLHGLSQAIPPAYTEFIGAQLLDSLERAS